MIIQLLPSDVPNYWEAIKFACVKADNVSTKDIPAYATLLLNELLCSKAQCFVGIDDTERTLDAIGVTKIKIDSMKGDKLLEVSCLYAWKGQADEFWIDAIELVKKFAKQTECKQVIARSSNPRVFEIVESVGFREAERIFSLLV